MSMKVLIADMNSACTSNSYLSACLRAFCKNNGYEITGSHREADVFIVNGCNVVQRNWEMVETLRKLALRRPDITVMAFGCTPTLKSPKKPDERNFHILPLRMVARDPLAPGRTLKSRVPFAFTGMDGMIKGRTPAGGGHLPKLKGIFYLKISDGCPGRCSFCALRQAKGSVKSVPKADILREFKSGLRKGRKRFFLISDDAASWGRDIGTDLSWLVKSLVRAAPDCRLTSTTFNPQSLLPLMEKLSPFFGNFEHLSIPIQSGSDRILKSMNRNYSADSALAMAERIREINPRIRLNTDVIVGYPTETREEFMDSLGAASRFDSAFFFMFTPYPSTPAAALNGKISRAEMKHRFGVIRKLGAKYRFFDNFSGGVGTEI